MQTRKTLYILKCTNEKWYVGTTARHIYDRYEEHLRGEGAAWTALHKPINIINTMDNVDQFEEDRQTKILMIKHGINNVRGGSYVAIRLPEYQLKSLKQELCTAGNLCFKCGSPGHYANNCRLCQDICFRCGQMGHNADICPKTEILMPIPDEDLAVTMSVPLNIIDDYSDMTLPGYSIICSNCGLNGHVSSDCNINITINTKRCGPLPRSRTFIAPEPHKDSCRLF